jgi:hypothetical protein
MNGKCEVLSMCYFAKTLHTGHLCCKSAVYRDKRRMRIGRLWFYFVDGRRHCGDDGQQAEPREHGVQAGRVEHEGSDPEAVCRDACRPGFQVSLTLVALTAQSADRLLRSCDVSPTSRCSTCVLAEDFLNCCMRIVVLRTSWTFASHYFLF